MSQKTTTQYYPELSAHDTSDLNWDAIMEREAYEEWFEDNPCQSEAFWTGTLPEWYGMDDYQYRQWERAHGI